MELVLGYGRAGESWPFCIFGDRLTEKEMSTVGCTGERACPFPPGPDGMCVTHSRATDNDDSLKAFGATIRGFHRRPHVTAKPTQAPPTRVYNGRSVNDWTAIREKLGTLQIGETRTVEVPAAFRVSSVKRNSYSCGVRGAICVKERKRWRLELRSGEDPNLLYVTRTKDWDGYQVFDRTAPVDVGPPVLEPIEQTPEIDIQLKRRIHPSLTEDLPFERIEDRVRIKPEVIAAQQKAIGADWKTYIPADPPEAQQLLEASIRYSGPVKQTEEEYTDLFDNVMPDLARKVALHRHVKGIVDGVFGEWIAEHQIDGFMHPEQFLSLFEHWQKKVTELLAQPAAK